MDLLTISTIALSNLKNAEHVQFHTNVMNVIEGADAEAIGLSELVYGPYTSAIMEEQDIVNKAQGSAYTLEMQQADEERDLIFKRVRRKLELCEFENPASVAFKATSVVKKHLLGKYSNSVGALPYQEETATITGLIKDCREILTSEQVSGIGIDGDLDDLQMANQKFERMYQERVAEKAAGDTQLSLKLRAATDGAYQLFVLSMNQLANDPTPGNSAKVNACREAVGKINVVVRDAKNRLAQRLGGVVVVEDAPAEETSEAAVPSDVVDENV